jgi:hypothetical protein
LRRGMARSATAAVAARPDATAESRSSVQGIRWRSAERCASKHFRVYGWRNQVARTARCCGGATTARCALGDRSLSGGAFGQRAGGQLRRQAMHDRQGGGYDTYRRRVMMHTTERDAMVRHDAYRACVARRTAVAQQTVPVYSRPSYLPRATGSFARVP